MDSYHCHPHVFSYSQIEPPVHPHLMSYLFIYLLVNSVTL